MAVGMDRQHRQWRVPCQRRALHGTPSRKKVCRREKYLELGDIFRKASHEYHSQKIIDDVVAVTVAMKYCCFRLALSYFSIPLTCSCYSRLLLQIPSTKNSNGARIPKFHQVERAGYAISRSCIKTIASQGEKRWKNNEIVYTLGKLHITLALLALG